MWSKDERWRLYGVKKMKDEVLIEAIELSGYKEYKDVNLDDLPPVNRSAVILAGELIALRPDLYSDNPDIVYILERVLENGTLVYELPKKNLSELLKKEPFDDLRICTYSLSEEKISKRIYCGNGTKWMRY